MFLFIRFDPTNYVHGRKRKLMKKRTFTFVFAGLLVSTALWAQQNTSIGTWKTNAAKSKADPGPPDKTSTKNEPSGTTGVKTTVDGVGGNGNPVHYEYTYNYDGKDYPVTGSPNFDTVSARRIDANTTVSVWKKGSTVVRIIRATVAKDGKSRTLDQVGAYSQGPAFHNVVFQEKQ